MYQNKFTNNYYDDDFSLSNSPFETILNYRVVVF
jgi:hypothetical protein